MHFTAAVATLLAVHGVAASHRRPKVVFYEDFSGKELDRARWNVIVPKWVVNNEQQAYIDSPDTLRIVHGKEAGGVRNALLIQANYSPAFVAQSGRKFDFTSGRIDTRGKEEFQYGTFSARMKLPVGLGFWPAFWALGDGRWPQTGEIDIMENVGFPDWTSQALHGPGYFGNTPLVNHTTLKKSISDWHVYSVDWSADLLVFRIDGDEVYRVTKAMVEKYGPWAFDNPKHIILNLAIGGTYPKAQNKVSTPYPGLPQETVDLIKAGKAQVLVQWVRVTQP
jgi:beta-glucanase (GH16 family)